MADCRFDDIGICLVHSGDPFPGILPSSAALCSVGQANLEAAHEDFCGRMELERDERITALESCLCEREAECAALREALKAAEELAVNVRKLLERNTCPSQREDP